MNEEYQIWRVVDLERDIWVENAIVFLIDKDPMEYFTIENIYEMYNVFEEDKEYYEYKAIFRDGDTINFTMAKGINYEDGVPTDYDQNNVIFNTTFYKMSKVKIFEK